MTLDNRARYPVAPMLLTTKVQIAGVGVGDLHFVYGSLTLASARRIPESTPLVSGRTTVPDLKLALQ